jgi:hypothetical protein
MATELERLVAKEGITIDAKPSTAKPPFPTDKPMIAWDVTMKYRTRRMKTAFFASPGYEPRSADVIYSLCREAKSLEETGGTFDTWAQKFNYSTDSRMAYSMWEGISKTAPRLKNFLGRKFKEFSGARHL